MWNVRRSGRLWMYSWEGYTFQNQKNKVERIQKKDILEVYTFQNQKTEFGTYTKEKTDKLFNI